MDHSNDPINFILYAHHCRDRSVRCRKCTILFKKEMKRVTHCYGRKLKFSNNFNLVKLKNTFMQSFFHLPIIFHIKKNKRWSKELSKEMILLDDHTTANLPPSHD